MDTNMKVISSYFLVCVFFFIEPKLSSGGAVFKSTVQLSEQTLYAVTLEVYCMASLSNSVS